LYIFLVYIIIKLLLLLPIAAVIVERVFPTMHIIKSKLQNMMRNKRINDSLIMYFEKDIFDEIDNEVIMKRF